MSGSSRGDGWHRAGMVHQVFAKIYAGECFHVVISIATHSTMLNVGMLHFILLDTKHIDVTGRVQGLIALDFENNGDGMVSPIMAEVGSTTSEQTSDVGREFSDRVCVERGEGVAVAET